jgi:hypothetical protein
MIKNYSGNNDPFQQVVIKELEKCGSVGVGTAGFLSSHKVKLKFSKQSHSGAAWSMDGNIHLNARDYSPDSNPGDPALLSLVVHEVHHLQQSFVMALSVYGELDAWQVGFRFYQAKTKLPLHPILRDLLNLPLNWDRSVLKYAADLMKTYSPGYRIHLLPLYPFDKEIIWRFNRREPA